MHDTSELTLPNRYQAYLVRLWREHDHGAWRVMVKHIQSGQEHHFNNLTDYFAFLHAIHGNDLEMKEVG